MTARQLYLFDDMTEEDFINERLRKLEREIDKARKGVFKRYSELEKLVKELKSHVGIS